MVGMGGIIIGQLAALADAYPDVKNGCFLDTNILVSASLPIDPRNDAAEGLIEEQRLQIPVFSNVNIREMIPLFIGKYG